PYYDDTSFAPRDLAGKFDWLVAGSSGRDQGEIGASPVTESIDRRMRIIRFEYNSLIQSQSQSLLDFVLIKVDAQHPAAICFQQLSRYQADKTKPTDDY